MRASGSGICTSASNATARFSASALLIFWWMRSTSASCVPMV
ncbi:MAG: hypothetical protein ACD_54C00122G0002 [uncultured bacterium]|nr:MAG: hypothetical protein ACD_54C00122G0002 [uncultured bacterium]